MEEGSIKDKLNRLIEQNQKLLEQKEIKKWKMPFSGKLNKKQVKKNYVTYLIVRENRRIDFVKAPIEEGTTMIDGIPRVATAEHVLFDNKGAPVIIQPEWSTTPFSPESNYDETVKLGRSAAGAKLLLNKMEKEALDIKKSGGGGNIIIWIVVGIAVIGGIAYLSGVKFF